MLNRFAQLPSGLSWSDIDIEIIDAPIRPYVSTVNFIIDMSLYMGEYYNSKQIHDLFGRNQAQWGKVQRRNSELNRRFRPVYEDTYDYTHGYGILVFLGSHLAMIQDDTLYWEGGVRPHHALMAILVCPSNHLSEKRYFSGHFYSREDYGMVDNSIYGGRAKIATLGGTAFFLLDTPLMPVPLLGGINVSNDRNLENKQQMVLMNYYIVNSSGFQSVEDAVLEFFKLTNCFNSLGENRPRYAAVPIAGYNSNSWIHGLLRASSLENFPTLPVSLPGWNRYVPASYFGIPTGINMVPHEVE